MFIVTAGTIEITRTTDGIEQLVVTFGPGMFSGEGAMLTGRPVVVRIRAGEPGEVIELDRDALLSLIQTDSELSEILLRAFILGWAVGSVDLGHCPSSRQRKVSKVNWAPAPSPLPGPARVAGLFTTAGRGCATVSGGGRARPAEAGPGPVADGSGGH